MITFDIIKHETVLVMKILNSHNDKQEHHVDVLKNSEKIKNIDLQSLYDNLFNFEETKILCKEIREDNFKDKSFALLSKKSGFTPYNDNGKPNNADSEEDYYVNLVSSAYMIVKHHGDKKFGGSRMLQTKFNSSTQKRVDPIKNDVEKKDEGKCLYYGGTNHFARDCKVKKINSMEQSYDTKYKRLVASIQKQNLESKVLIVEGEDW